MQERSRINVDEAALQQMMTAGVPLHKAQEISKQVEVEPDVEQMQDREEHEFDVESGMRNLARDNLKCTNLKK